MKISSETARIALRAIVFMPLCFGLAGCISSSSPNPPASTTVVVPQGATTTTAAPP